jgi:carbon monoxide dehydrogenase subunit G
VKLTGEQRIAVPQQIVWEGLNDPDVLRQCIPGCQSLERESDDRLKATVAIKVGPIGARFAGAVTLSDLDPPNAYTISGEGAGGAAGFAKGSAKVRLSDEGGGTLLSYDVDAQVGGRIAQLGGAIIDATAKQLAGTFFKRFGEVMAERGAPAAEAAPIEASPEAAMAASEPSVPITPAAVAPRAAGFPWIWLVALAVAALAGFLLGRVNGNMPVWAGLSLALLVVVVTLVGFSVGIAVGRGTGGAGMREE